MTKTAESIGLGIDAGGTFTDGAVVDLSTGTVLSKFKTPTVKDDLPGSIRRCLGGLDAGLFHDCALVSLSTTFATNAIVEGKGARAGAILLGYDEFDVARVHADHRIAVKGRHDIRGRLMEPLDESGLRDAIRRLIEEDRVEALAISGMGGVLNPAHEIAALEIASEVSGLPVVCGHELSMELDAIRRANTAYFNARLLPVVVDLIRSVEAELRNRGIDAPVVVVRSDGSLMSASEALTHPIHTIFSGPAASAIGALYLSGVKDGLVADIGGTTTDILTVRDGEAIMTAAGSKVAGLAISIPSVFGHTVGFGGDSRITRDTLRKLHIGPERVIPICVLAHMSPVVLEELNRLKTRVTSTLCQPVDFYTTGWSVITADLSPKDLKILAALRDGPKSADQLSDMIGCPHPSLLSIDGLVRSGVILRAGLTPTDVLHVTGRFDAWNSEAARLGVELYADALEQNAEVFNSSILDMIDTKLAEELLSAALGAGHGSLEITKAVVNGGSSLARIRAEFVVPVIGIGAPIREYLPDACRVFDMQPIIPEHSEVANAVGAVAGRVAVKAKAVISPLSACRFSVRTPLDHRDFADLEKAENHAADRLKKYLKDRVHEDYEGYRFRYEIRVDRRHAAGREGEVLVESVVMGTAVCTSTPSRYL